MSKKHDGISRFISLAIIASLVISAAASFPLRADAAIDSSDKETVKSMCYTVRSTPDISYFSDDFFRGDSLDYNVSLSALSYVLCNTSYSSWDGEDGEKHLSLRNYLNDNGFTDFDLNEDYIIEPSSETSAVACAHKKITDNGKTYTLLAVIPRSGTFGAEFGGNMNVSSSADDTGDHYEYIKRKNKVRDFVKGYIKKYSISGDLKVWTTGYSGGAGISALYAADLIKDPVKTLGKKVSLRPSDLYCYEFCSLRVAGIEGDWDDSRYDYIHNVYSDDDYLSDILTGASFDRYGSIYKYEDYADKDRMLELLRIDSEKSYNSYISSGDPALYKTCRFDLRAGSEGGGLPIVEDDKSYLPDNQAAFIDSMADYMSEFCAQSGDGVSRKGFYKQYQEPMEHMIGFLMGNGIAYDRLAILMKALTGSERSIPLLLSMYMSFALNRSMTDTSADMNDSMESSFNMMADIVEDENGELRAEYEYLKLYKKVRDALFERTEDSSYVLKQRLELQADSKLLKRMKQLTAVLYSEVLGEALEESGIDQETIDQLTSDEDSAGASWLLTNFFFGNSLQDPKKKSLSIDENQYFKQAATLIGNMSRLITAHMYTSVMEWIRAADPLYDDYSRGTTAQNTGYRRVFISGTDGADISGSVTYEDGSTAATFKNGRLLSRTDEWIGITTSDRGNWLRLPLDQGYKVSINVGKPTALSVRVADQAVADPEERRSVTGDANGSWTGFRAVPSDRIVLSVPAAEKKDNRYDLTSAEYTLDISGSGSGSGGESASAAGSGMISEVYSGSLPKVKKFRVKASKKAFTASWKKLSSGDRKKFSRIEMQYSTSRSFDESVTVTREIKNTKKSLKVKKIRKGRKYYVRARNIRYADGVKYVSKWTSVKKIKGK